MPRRITPRTTLENLKNEAKRWLKELRANDAEARARFDGAYPDAPVDPGLREVQRALALEYGFPAWPALRQAVEDQLTAAAAREGLVATNTKALAGAAQYERLAADMVSVYATGDAHALQRINEHYGRSSTVDDLRATVWRLMYKVRQAKGAAHAFGMPEAQELIARTSGFSNWTALTEAAAHGAPSAVPAYAVNAKENKIAPLRNVSPDEWDTIAGVIKERHIAALEANGHMTDDAVRRLAGLDCVTSLSLGGSRQLSDDGLLQLAHFPQLEHLDLSEYPGGKLTDRGLEVVRHLPNLRMFTMTWQRGISDAGVANLRFCDKIESVNLMGSPTGDGAIEALRGKPFLRRLDTGRLVTDSGLAMLRDFPLFKTWRGAGLGDAAPADDHEPTHLLIDGPFTNKGLASLAGLDGVYALDLFWHVTGITTDAFEVLAHMPRLVSLGCDGDLADDRAMRHIAAIPRLRNLRAQGAIASDDGFACLSRSATLEKLWGRECPNFTGRGFLALSRMPALRVLGVSCKNVDDEALSNLPNFPALRELTSIGISDYGFRHVGRCEKLERLSCMYCRDTTDVATGHIAALELRSYYAGLTQITDRSLEILGRMKSLESIELFETKGVTDAGLVFLSGLPRLREVHLSGLPGVTFAGTTVFPSHVHVEYDV